MNDTVLTTVSAGNGNLFGVLYALILGGLIVPLVQWLKRFQWMGGAVDPSFVTAVLAIGTAWGLTRVFAPEFSLARTIEFALSALGGATLVYRGGKVYARTKTGGE